ncbi:S8 family peptidase [Cohnella faecalis]|uniref:Fibronectin type-III domain-containing protein n=1 Tax=Cohnella faecalis TaxID=2315694 RepID=A0A398CM79_9BACL|nr:S8 family peptidase [Cohnella faecalis]RIE03555.1 hypothetical protein D3H35_10985 [Cohnella faecalis]
MKGLIRFLCLITALLLIISTVHPSLTSAESAKPNGFIIKLKNNANADAFISKRKLQGKKPKKTDSLNIISVDLSYSDYKELLKDSEIAFVESDAPVFAESRGKGEKRHPFIDNMKKSDQNVPWGIHSIGADLSNSKNIAGKNTKIAILDTGISAHPDLKVVGGISFVPSVASYLDDNGHGTHVAGIVAAKDNRIGVLGAAPEADIYSVKVLDKDGAGTYGQVIQGIEWAIQNKMDVISMSFGGDPYSEALHMAVKAATDNGIVVVAAAGNGGYGEETETYPARFEETISVGAVTKSHRLASFSSMGSEIDLVAPGQEIVSTSKDGDYVVMSGTSMAAPHVTGAVAALLSKNKKMSVEQLKKTLYSSATPLGSANQYGHGLVNLAKALGIVRSAIPPVEEPVVPSLPIEEPPVVEQPQTGFNINAIDDKLLALSNELLALKEEAAREGKRELAKRIEDDYQAFLLKNKELHILPIELSSIRKEDVVTKFANENVYFKQKELDFSKLEEAMKEAASSYAQLLPGFTAVSDQSDVGISAYDIVGNNQHIYPGQSATVSLKVSSAKPSVTIGVMNPSDTKIDGTIFYNVAANAAVSYTWYSSSSTPTGLYKIKYYYDSVITPDYFYIYVDPLPAPSAPGGLSSSATSSSLTLYWSGVSGATSYDVSLNGTYLANVTGTSYTFSSLSSGTGYSLGVRAKNASGSSSYSTISATTLSSAPGAPSGLSASSTTSSITLSWSPVSGAASYSLYRNGSLVTTTTSTSYTYSGLAGGTSYSVGVSTNNASGSSAVSSMTVSTQSGSGAPAAPSGLSASSTSNNITLSWLAVSGATSYTLQLNGTTVTTTASTSYTFSGLAANTTYTVGVAAVNGSGSSLFSTSSVATKAVSMPNLTLNSSVDVDLASGAYQAYAFTPSSTGTYKIFTGPYGGVGTSNDTVLELYSNSSLTSSITSNDDSNGTTFSEINWNLTGGTTYYVKLRGYGSTAVHARLSAVVAPPAPITMSLNVGYDVDSASGTYKVYKFTPSSSGQYKLFTGYFGGTSSGGSNDTLLYVYSDANLTNQLAYNDDSNGSTFSQIVMSMSAGVSYYVKIAGYGSGAVHARLTANAVTAAYAILAGNTPTDVDLAAGVSQTYQFTPTVSGPYLLTTGPYGGAATGANDTTLTLYSDAALASQIAFDDDSNGSGFSRLSATLSAGVTYYLKLAPYSSSIAVHARLLAVNDHGNDFGSAYPISLGSSTTASINYAGDVDFFRFQPASNGVYSIDTTGGTDTVVEVYDQKQILLGYSDDYLGPILLT